MILLFRSISRSNLKRIISLTLAIFCLSGPANADDIQRLQKIKAAFVYNIAKFVSWPTTEGQSQLRICYFKTAPERLGFNVIDSKRVHDLVITGSKVDSIEEALDCNILFIPEPHLVQFNAESWSKPLSYTLTIADLTDLKENHAIASLALINLVRQGARIGLEIDLQLVQQSPLQISSELLKIARIRR